MAFGDYLQFQRDYTPVFGTVFLDGSAKTATTPPMDPTSTTSGAGGASTGGAVRSATYQIFVQKLTLSYATHVAGKVFTVQDANSNIIANRADLAAAAGVPDVVTWDFGPEGVALALGKDLQYIANTGGTGFVGVFTYSGYQKRISAVGIATTN